MPETLGITYDALRREVGRMLGIGRDYTLWDATKASDVNDIIKSGLRSVYFPVVPIEGGTQSYIWSFLKKRSTITLVTDNNTYDLPSNFGGMISVFSYPDSSGYRSIDPEPEEDVVSIYATNSKSGAPFRAAVRAKETLLEGETQYEAVLYPKPDAVVNGLALSYRYFMIPPMLTETNQKPLGSPMVALAILGSCLSEAEKTLWDTEGVHTKRFAESLARSIEYDKKFG